MDNQLEADIARVHHIDLVKDLGSNLVIAEEDSRLAVDTADPASEPVRMHDEAGIGCMEALIPNQSVSAINPHEDLLTTAGGSV